MKQTKTARQAVLSLIALLAALWPCAARAQGAYPVAVQPMQLSAFGGISGVYTGLSGGKNLSVTAGCALIGVIVNGKVIVVGDRRVVGPGCADFVGRTGSGCVDATRVVRCNGGSTTATAGRVVDGE